MNLPDKIKEQTNEDEYIQPRKTWKCRLGFHLWCPVHQSRGSSICMRCNLMEDYYGKRVAMVKKDGSVL